MPEHYFIDGYNVLHRSRSLRQRASEDLESARELLIDRVAQYCGSSGARATIVFDGQGSREERESNFRGAEGLDVIYAPANQSADAIIERAIFRHPDRRNSVVVSGDRGITDLCIGLGALAMTPDGFLAAISDDILRIRAKVERDRAGRHVASVEERVDESGRQRLEELRRRLDREER